MQLSNMHAIINLLKIPYKTCINYRNKFLDELITYFPLYDTDRIGNDAPKYSLLPPKRVYRAHT
jgi:hypothetical protein